MGMALTPSRDVCICSLHVETLETQASLYNMNGHWRGRL